MQLTSLALLAFGAAPALASLPPKPCVIDMVRSSLVMNLETRDWSWVPNASVGPALGLEDCGADVEKEFCFIPISQYNNRGIILGPGKSMQYGDNFNEHKPLGQCGMLPRAELCYRRPAGSKQAIVQRTSGPMIYIKDFMTGEKAIDECS